MAFVRPQLKVRGILRMTGWLLLGLAIVALGAIVHGRGIGDTGSAKLGDIDRAHCLLLS